MSEETDLVEVVARGLMAFVEERRYQASLRGEAITADLIQWQSFVPSARAALSAISAAGFVVVKMKEVPVLS